MSQGERWPLRRLRASPAWQHAVVADRDTVRLVATWLVPIAQKFWNLDQFESEPSAINICPLADDQVRALLRKFEAQLGERVLALWYWDVVAAFLNYSDFVEYFDDLWYPSAENVWLVSCTNRAFLTINHEEYVVAGTISDTGELRLLEARR